MKDRIINSNAMRKLAIGKRCRMQISLHAKLHQQKLGLMLDILTDRVRVE